MKKLIHLKIDEVCRFCGLDQEHIQYFIHQEWITPFDQESLIFDDEDLARIGLIHELQDELGVNDEAVPIILNLIDQLNFLRSEMKRFER